MGLGESLGNAYMRVEDAYYGVLDFFEEKGIGIPWAYNDLLESKGVPALPVTIALIVLLLGGAFWVASSNQPQNVTFTLSLQDDKGRALQDVSVKILDEQGTILKELTASDGTSVTLEGISPHATLTIQAQKTGFGSASNTMLVGEDGVSLSLAGANDAIVGKLKLVDSETQTTITDASVKAEWPEASVPLTVSPGADGIVLLNVPLDQEISITVSADNYEDLVDTITFSNGDVKVKELTPKASASAGPSVLLVKAVDAKTQLPVEGVHIKIENVATNETISDLDAPTGSHSENLSKGQVVRVSVSKDGYLTYASAVDFPEGKTLRKDEETILAPLAFGGASLHVITENEANQQPLQGVDVEIRDAQNQKVDAQTSSFAGEALFPGLSQTETYTALAFHPNFFPKRASVDWATLSNAEDGKSMNLVLTPFTSGEAGVLTVFVNDADGKAVSQASVSVDEKDGDSFLPLIAPRSVDSVGSFTARLKVGMSIRVTAQSADLGSATQDVQVAGGLNKVVLVLNENTSLVHFTLSFLNGQPFNGALQIKTSGGNEWYSGSVTQGSVSALVPVNQPLTIHASTSDGKSYTKSVTVLPEQDSVSIVLDSSAGTASAAPEVTFDGLVGADGQPLAGLSPDADAFARFTLKWPAGASKGGLFVRVGDDALASSDSQFAGVYGLNGDADTIAYGRSWTPLPVPGNETKDRKTMGKAGTISKWIEVVKKNPVGTITWDVRLKTRAGVQAGTIPLAYRAFVESAGKTLRMPNDTELGDASYVSTKSGLYAQTRSVNVPIYPTQPFCQGSICATIQFVDKDNRFFPIGNFQSQRGLPYAIQVTILPALSTGASPNTGAPTGTNTPTPSGEGLIPLPGASSSSPGTGITLKANVSPENPLLVFTKTEVGVFGPLADTGNKDTSVSVPIPSVNAQNGAQARIQFVPQDVGNDTITVQLVSSTSAWTQSLPIEIVESKPLNVTIPENADPSTPFTITVLDDAGNPVSNALITLTTPDGKFAASVKGNGNAGKGENGKYLIDKPLDAGLYGVNVKVPGFADAQGSISIGIKVPLTLPEKISITIPFGQTSVVQSIVVTNTTKYPLSNVSGELVTADSFPSSLKVDVGPIPGIPANGKASIQLTATYSGDPADETPRSGSGILRVTGDAAKSFPIKGESPINVAYNPALDAACLKFNKTQLSVTFLGDTQPYGNMYDASGQANANANYYGFSQVPNTNVLNAAGYNGLGYNANGNYQNAEQKQVTVNATNNCGVDLTLIPGISIVDGQPQVDGLRLAAVDSSLKLLKGQSQAVNFTISNDLYRAGFLPQNIQYAATFRAPQLSASIPLNITFWDRSRALQTPNSVELRLIKTNNQKASDRAIIPITNIGAGPIYDVRGTLDGDTANDVTVKLENNPTNTNSYASVYGGLNAPIIPESGSARGVLQPGQSLYPPLSVVAESTRDTPSTLHKTLSITGLVEGRRVNLRNIDVFIQTGSSSCLEISALDTPISLVSSELSGTIASRITIQNKCLEPVRITQVNPSNAGANTLTLTPLEGTEILDKDAQQEFQVQLTKGSAYKAQVSLTVKGVMLLSQKGIESNALPLEIRLGKDELESTHASNPVEVPACEGGTLTVRFPLLAKKTECGQAYCDATQASGMLADAMEQTIAKVVQAMQSKKNDATQFPQCDMTKRYCTFSQLGIKPLNLDVFFQNDTLTPNVLSYTMRDGTYPRLSSMQADTLTQLSGEAGQATFLGQLGNGRGNKVFIPEIQGCGSYQLSLVGGVEVATNQLQPDQINIGFLLKSKQNTGECQDKIYNAANFLPKDRSLTSTNTQGTLLGMVEYEPSLKDAAEWLADTVFGSETRASSNTGSNRMHLRIGNLTQSIIELSLDPSTAGEAPKNIFTTVRKTNGSVQKETMIEAGKIITSLGKSVNGCITKDEETWKIYSVKDVGQFTLEGCMLPGTPEGGLVVRPILTCCELTAKSDIQSDASFTLDPRGQGTIPGLTMLNLFERDAPATPTTPAQPGHILENGASTPLAFVNAGQSYQKPILVCGIADPRTQQQANKTLVHVAGLRAIDDTKAGPHTLQLKTCALDADDALAKAYAKGNGTWYATLDWDDKVNSKTILETVEETTANNKLGNAYVSYAGQGIHANDSPVYQAKLNEKKIASIGKFGLTCAAACGACQGAMALATLGASLAAASWDCLTACGVGTAAGAYEVYKDQANNTILETPKNIVEGTYGVVRNGAESLGGVDSANNPGFSSALAGTAASAVKTWKSPLYTLDEKKNRAPIFQYTPPKTIVDTKDLAFLEDVKNSVAAKAANNRQVATDYLGQWQMKQPAPGQAKIPTAPQGPQRTLLANKVETLELEKKKLSDGFEALRQKYAKSPGFDPAEYTKLETQLNKEINEAQRMFGDSVTGLRYRIKNGLNTPIEAKLNAVLQNTEKLTAETASKASKLKYPENWFNSKGATTVKNAARGLVCGTTGSIAGYAAYRNEITQEIENKIELTTGSTNVLDPQTNILTFIKGQTYVFSVTPTQGTGKSNRISIDIVSPTTPVNPSAWLDDCAQK